MMKGYDTLNGQTAPSAPPPPYSYHYSSQQPLNNSRPLESFVSRQPTTPGYIIQPTTTTVHIPRRLHTTQIHHVDRGRDCCCCCCSCPFWVCTLIMGLILLLLLLPTSHH